jgi:hypothetical protein
MRYCNQTCKLDIKHGYKKTQVGFAFGAPWVNVSVTKIEKMIYSQ